ncbi:DUF2326 domain-containing protein [Methylobacterium sp. Leaf99]|uniref:DUF2326 domain-containing protein n=1 Tax=Methylobacterium sp. Leaf99 TaxID=1736251 RepID=UPI00190FD398|nr:DUF2326 domain-containing protein [Methylobacterium sp. Leaf99]
MLIKRLYTEPAFIDPITFMPGVNVILGESDETSSKNNGVGKSLCIEFVSFALLKRKSESRVAKIPEQVLDPSIFICVELEIHGVACIIKRSLEAAEQPRIVVDGHERVYTKVKDATDFLTGKLFPDQSFRVGFREILGPLIRDERSEFKSLVACFDTNARIPDNYAPHLMLLGINIEIYRSIKGIQKEIDLIAVERARIKDSVKLVRQKNLEEARTDLNALDGEVETIRRGIDSLKNAEAYDIVKDEILEIEDQCSEFRLRKDVLVTRSKKLEPIALEAIVDTDEIRDFYDQLRAGLGTSIVRDLNEVISFKSKIENFQHYLLQEKRKIINVEIRKLNSQLSELDNRYATLMSVLDQEGHLSNLRQTYASFQAKSDELGQLKSFLGRYDALLIERQDKKSQIEAENLLLRASILAVSEQLESFQRSIIAIHYFIQGNRNASFGVSVTAKKHVVDIILRIDDDGSHSVEREKVFIYDIALLLNVYTKYRHPGILIHDNIFDVDDDTLQRNLEFILTRARFDDEQQYILTINLDRIEHYQDEF